MANPIDEKVGRNIRRLRWAAGITQNQLAENVQLTGEGIEQYECGSNRVSAYYLWRFAGFFRVPITAFFDLSEFNDPEALAATNAIADILMDREAAKLVWNYNTLTTNERRAMFAAAKIARRRGIWPAADGGDDKYE